MVISVALQSSKTAILLGPRFEFTRNTPMFTCIFQDQNFLISPLFRLTKHSPSLQKASRSNPCPTFSNCTQNDVTSVPFCLTNFRKYTIVYYCCRLVRAYHAAKHRNGYCIFIISSKSYSPCDWSTLWVYFFLRICYHNNCTFKSWKEFCWIAQCYETM